MTEKFHPRLYRKRQFVLQEGDVCTQFNFVVRGCLRMYKIDEQGDIHILQFATENYWIIDLGSFHGEKPSELNIDAIEDTMVLQISHKDLISLYLQASKFDRIFRVLIENSFVGLQKRLLQNISSTAEDRYQYFLGYLSPPGEPSFPNPGSFLFRYYPRVSQPAAQQAKQAKILNKIKTIS